MGNIARHFGAEGKPQPEGNKLADPVYRMGKKAELNEKYHPEWSTGEILFQHDGEQLNAQGMRERVNTSLQILDGGKINVHELDPEVSEAVSDYIQGSYAKGMTREEVRTELITMRQLLEPVDHGSPDIAPDYDALKQGAEAPGEAFQEE